VQISADAMTDAVGVAKVIDELSKAGVKQVTLLSLKRQ
jgi:biopolymer transport protein ExbD